MKFNLIFFICFIPHGFAMGDSHFIPGNPVDIKDLPDIDELRDPKKRSEEHQQREEFQPPTDEKKKALPSRAMEEK